MTPKPKTKLLNSKTKHYWTLIHLFQNTTFDLLSKKCPKNDRKKFKVYGTYKIFSIQYINVISRVKTVHLFCIVQTLPDSSNFQLHFYEQQVSFFSKRLNIFELLPDIQELHFSLNN